VNDVVDQPQLMNVVTVVVMVLMRVLVTVMVMC
jgi:hypothetical protein